MKTILLLTISAAFSLFGLSAVARDRNVTSHPAAVLDADDAAQLAATLANAEARRKFDAAPFGAAQSAPKFSDGRWQWRAVAGYGRGDLQAVVSFSQNGSKPKVQIQPLILELRQKAMDLPRVKEP
jgi:hypothetical protein